MNHTTRRFPRTTAEAFGLSPSEANPFQSFKPSRIKRFFYAICDWGWVAVPVLLAVAVLTGCGEVDTYRASQSDLSDAQAQARKELRQIAMGAQQ